MCDLPAVGKMEPKTLRHISRIDRIEVELTHVFLRGSFPENFRWSYLLLGTFAILCAAAPIRTVGQEERTP